MAKFIVVNLSSMEAVIYTFNYWCFGVLPSSKPEVRSLGEGGLLPFIAEIFQFETESYGEGVRLREAVNTTVCEVLHLPDEEFEKPSWARQQDFAGE